MVTQQQFKDFLAEIEPSNTTKSNCATSQSNLRDRLRADESWGKEHCLNTKLSGSYKRHTAIRPRKLDGVLQIPDIDILVITDYSKNNSPKDILNELDKAIQRIGYENTKKQNRSINISLSTVEMDVVLLIAPYGYDAEWFIGDKKSDTWIFTDPRKQAQYTIEKNKEYDNYFVPLVKLFKWWRREFPISTRRNRPKGIAIEKMVGDNFETGESIGEIFVLTIEKMVAEYESSYLVSTIPYVTDPGDGYSNLLDGLSSEDFSKFYKHLSKAAEIARKAYDSTDEEESLSNWRKIFGPEFPKAKSTAFSNNNSSGFTYPNTRINPNKPAGFGVR